MEIVNNSVDRIKRTGAGSLSGAMATIQPAGTTAKGDTAEPRQVL